MEFNGRKPIFLQICDILLEQILSGELKINERLLSVRDLGEKMLVNPNTAQRAYLTLQEKGIVEQRRGIGYFTTVDSVKIARETKRREFIREQLPQLFKAMELLEISWDELKQLYKGCKEKI